MFRGTVVSHSRSPKNFFSSPDTCCARFVRSSSMVNTTPSINSPGFSDTRILSTVSINSLIPSRAKYSACIGISTESAATNAFSVSKSSAGGQSITMYSNLSRKGASASFKRNSRRSTDTSSMLAPIKSLRDGISHNCSSSVCWSASWAVASPIRTS